MRRIRVCKHIRTVKGQLREIPEHWRHIGDAEPEPVRIERDDRTRELFGDVATICALAEMPDGAVITGALLMAARKDWGRDSGLSNKHERK